jgi:hypothetical protein
MANGTRPPTFLLVFAASIVGCSFVGCARRGPEPVPQPTSVPTAVLTPPTLAPTPVCTPGATLVPKAKNWKLIVGPDACRVAEEEGSLAPVAVISAGNLHQIKFKSDAGQSLAIILHVPQGWLPPFKGMAFTGLDPQGLSKWALSCEDPKNWCSTGPADKKATFGCYKYDQVLDDKTCDAGIIIQK